MSNICKVCKYYEPPEGNDMMAGGRCVFPVPEWIKQGAAGGSFIPHYGHTHCATYEEKPLKD